jgi:hypothetical protein
VPDLALAVRATLGLEVVLEAKLDQRRDRVVGLQHDISTATAVTAVGTAFGHVCLSAKRHAARAAVATFDVDLYLVDEHSLCQLPLGRGPPQ